MKVGVSTASLYPLHVEDAFSELAALGIKTAEVFANSVAEGMEPYVGQISGIRDEYGMEITSFHPFSSPMESLFLFSTYDRRVDELIRLYKEFFKSMNRLGAKIFVVHGAISSSNCPTDLYMKQFALIAKAGREYGVTVAQKNVCYCMSGRLEFLKKMKEELGDLARFVLDLKQARRSGEDVFDYVKALGGNIVHCHVSDADGGCDCLPIGEGDFDFKRFTDAILGQGFDGAFIVELYRSNYDNFGRLKESYDRLREIVGV